jgi:hypothetical protein
MPVTGGPSVPDCGDSHHNDSRRPPMSPRRVEFP